MNFSLICPTIGCFDFLYWYWQLLMVSSGPRQFLQFTLTLSLIHKSCKLVKNLMGFS